MGRAVPAGRDGKFPVNSWRTFIPYIGVARGKNNLVRDRTTV